MAIGVTGEQRNAKASDGRLSSWPVRLAVYAVLVIVAVASIWLIDRRAVQRMSDPPREAAPSTRPHTPPSGGPATDIMSDAE